MSDFLDIATGGGMGLVGDVLGMVGQNAREKRAVRNQMELNKQGQKLGMKTWYDTNYGAQMDEMKKAGLSPGLMYGKGGAGGATVASPSGGSAPSPQPMEIGSAMNNALMMSQKGLMEAQAKKADAEADNLRGTPGTKGESEIVVNQAKALNLTEGAKTEEAKRGLMRAQTRVQDWTSEMQGATFQDVADSAKWSARSARATYKQEAVKANVSMGTQETQIKQINATYLNTMLDSKLKESNIELNEGKRAMMVDMVTQGQEKVNQGQQKIDLEQDAIRLHRRLGDENMSMQWIKTWLGAASSVIGLRGSTTSTKGYSENKGMWESETTKN